MEDDRSLGRWADIISRKGMSNEFPSNKGEATIEGRKYIGYERKVAFLIPEDATDLPEGLAIDAIASQTFWVHGYPCKMVVLD